MQVYVSLVINLSIFINHEYMNVSIDETKCWNNRGVQIIEVWINEVGL